MRSYNAEILRWSTILKSLSGLILTASILPVISFGQPSGDWGGAPGVGKILKSGDSFQAALDTSECGRPITLQAGQTWVGNFVLPVRGDSCIVIVQSSGILPANGIRIQLPADQLQMATLQTPNELPVISNGENNAHGYEFRGIEFTVTPNNKLNYALVMLTVNNPVTFADMPHHIGFVHSSFHGLHDFTGNYVRGLWPGAQFVWVRDSTFYDLHSTFMEAACVASYNAVGDQEFTNNKFVCAAENVMYGSNVRLPIDGWIPSRIIFKNNYFDKDPEYYTNPLATTVSVKNEWECKNCRYVTLDGNVFYNNHERNQSGAAVLFTPRTLNGAMPWAMASDITFVNNTIRHAVGGIAMGDLDDQATNILAADQMQPSRNIVIKNNLLDDLSSKYADQTHSTNYVIAFSVSHPETVTIDHNTVNSERYGEYNNPPFGFYTKCPPWPVVNETFTNNVMNAPVPMVAMCTGLPDAFGSSGPFSGNYFPQFSSPAGPFIAQFAIDIWVKEFPELVTPQVGVGADLTKLAKIEAAVVAGTVVQ